MNAPDAAANRMTAAASEGRIGDVIRLARQACSLSQTELGELCRCDQSTISRIERGLYTPDIGTLRRLAEALDIPAPLVGLAEARTANGSAPPTEDPVKRREFLLAATAVAAAPAMGAQQDEPLAAIHSITSAQRRLDATTPSRDLIESVTSHLRMATHKHMADPDPGRRQRLAAAVSEIAGYAAWLSWDMHDLGSARSHYATAIRAAAGTEERALHAYMLGSLASLAVSEGDATEGLALLRRAAAEIEPNPPAIAIAWLSCLEAVAQADARNARRCWDALDRAETAVDSLTAQEPPMWPWLFTFDAAKIARYRLTCAALLGQPAIAYSAARTAGDFLSNGHAKQRALAQLDLATACLTDREPEEAFRIAAGAVELGRAAQSGRVIDAARRFRRGFSGSPASPLVRGFDEQLYRTAF